MSDGIWHVLCRTRRRDNIPMRKLHESLCAHMDGILALGEHHPPTGRIPRRHVRGDLRGRLSSPPVLEVTHGAHRLDQVPRNAGSLSRG